MVLERYTILLYCNTSQFLKVNQAMQMLFANGRAIDNILPDQAALMQHVKRTAYQAGYIRAHTRVALQ